MHFRVTVRDGDPTGGGVDYADVTLKIRDRAGPFLVTSQDEGAPSSAPARGGR